MGSAVLSASPCPEVVFWLIIPSIIRSPAAV